MRRGVIEPRLKTLLLGKEKERNKLWSWNTLQALRQHGRSPKPLRHQLMQLMTHKSNFQVAELIGALADARIQAADSAELIASLQQQLKSKSQMKFNGSVYYKVDVEGNEDGPWCPTCFDARSQEIRLQRAHIQGSSSNWNCKECKTYFR